MTDKVQKIKEWIQTRKLCTMDEHMKFYCREAESDYNLLCSIEKVLDSLQEDPVTPVWHDASEVPQLNKELIVVGEFDNALVLSSNSESFKNRKVTKWAYFDDLLKLSNVERIGKNWKEDHVDKCKGCNNVKGCITCVDGDQWAHYEEPAREELQEAIDQSFIYHENRGDDFRIDEQIETAYRYGFESGAKWQEEQFEKNRLAHCDDLTAEQAQIESDFVVQHLKKYNRTPTFIDAIEYGMRLQKAQTMKDAVDGTMGFVSIHLKKPNFGEKFKEGVKVKILVIKED